MRSQGLESQSHLSRGFKGYRLNVSFVLPLLATQTSLLMLFTGLHLALLGYIFCLPGVMASMALCWKIRGKHSQCLLDSDCTPASSNLLGLRVRLSWLQSRCFLKNNRRAFCFFLIHQYLKLLLQWKCTLTKCSHSSGHSSQTYPMSLLHSLFLLSQHSKRK